MSEVNNLAAKVKTVKLGEYVISVKGKKPKRVSPVKTNECPVPYINIKAFEKNIIDEYTDGVGCALCNDGDFLMVWDGSRSGYVGKAIKGALGSTLVKLDFPDIDNNYAYYFLQSKFIEINTRAKGVGIPHVDPNILWNYDLLIPPKETQAAIVSKIEELFSELDNGIENLRTSQQQLKTYRQSVLKWAFEGKLTVGLVGHGGLPGASHKNANDSLIAGGVNDLPEGWKWVKAQDICETIQIGPFGTQLHKEDYIEDGIPLINPTHIVDGLIKADSSFTILKSKRDSLPNYILKEGDVIMGRRGEMARCGLVTKKENGWFCGTGSLYFRPKRNLLAPVFLYYQLRSEPTKKYLEDNAGGTTMANLNLKITNAIPIPLPPIEEQNAIIEIIENRLSVADKLEETISQSLQQAEALRQSILKRAFEGRLI